MSAKWSRRLMRSGIPKTAAFKRRRRGCLDVNETEPFETFNPDTIATAIHGTDHFQQKEKFVGYSLGHLLSRVVQLGNCTSTLRHHGPKRKIASCSAQRATVVSIVVAPGTLMNVDERLPERLAGGKDVRQDLEQLAACSAAVAYALEPFVISAWFIAGYLVLDVPAQNPRRNNSAAHNSPCAQFISTVSLKDFDAVYLPPFMAHVASLLRVYTTRCRPELPSTGISSIRQASLSTLLVPTGSPKPVAR
ncbi:hypothetical protein B0H14DRAFT_2605474 [Mycena olivaceomarginata]|nr:hypothetical protein B0H14DRAFT_2605474 [Mycena olivaceomarginata]